MAFSIARYRVLDYTSNDGYMFSIRPTGATSQTSTISKVSLELFNMVFRFLDPTTTCLGLTSKHLYSLCERHQSSLVRLDSHTTIKRTPSPSCTIEGPVCNKIVPMEVIEEVYSTTKHLSLSLKNEQA